ncbi:LUD domain-containing protein [Longispora sp. K20-0274]|uniref:LutC/YkgG family protein n=1 Tax=Longispora sp. K20-0274 TaxID=3088255 RepID=UPI00399A63FB
MSAREEILGRVRAALADAPDAPRPAPPAPDRPPASLVDLLAERIRDYRATVHVVAPADVPATIAAAMARRGARAMVAPEGVPADWLAAGVDWHRDTPALTARELDHFDGVLTGSALAVAVTGTIVLDGSAGQGRRAVTLVPDYHLCVVRTVVPGVAEALARLAADRPLTWISGPSATSDIELDRVEGVHGPRTLEVIVAVDG